MLRLVAALLLVGAAAPGSSQPSVEFAFADPAIVESSGLVVDEAGGLFVTTNDSGDDGRLFVVDPSTGETVGVSRWRSSTGRPDPVDVEALAPAGPGEVWVGDIGDNNAARDSVRLVRVPVGTGEREVSVEPYELVYPDGPRDAESLLVDRDGRVVIVTKELFGGEVLRSDGPLEAGRVTTLQRIGAALPIATDAAFFPDRRHLIVRNYGSAIVYAYPTLDEVGGFALPDQEQGEGIAVDAQGGVFLSSEGEGAPVLRVPLPDDVRRAMEPEPAPEPEPEASPTTDSSPSVTPDPARPETDETNGTDVSDRSEGAPPWRWIFGVLAGLGLLLVLARTLRPRG